MKHKPFTRVELNEFLARMPFNRSIGMCVTRMHNDGLTLECVVEPSLLNTFGTLHGGVSATVADCAIGMAIICELGGALVTTTDLTVSYLRPVAEGKIHARSHVIKAGKTLSVGSVEIRDAHRRLVATAMGTYMTIPQTPA